MTAKKYTITGKAQWAKLFPQNKDTKFHEGGVYQVTLKVDDSVADFFEATGSATKPKFDRKTKETTITLRRKHEAKYDWAGGPPKVLNADDTERKFEDGIIWNDSVVECEFTVYTTSKANGTRLEAVKILELAPEPEQEDKEDKPSSPKQQKEMADDDIPF